MRNFPRADGGLQIVIGLRRGRLRFEQVGQSPQPVIHAGLRIFLDGLSIEEASPAPPAPDRSHSTAGNSFP